MTVHPQPVASYTADPTETTILTPEITFTDLSIGAKTWHWSFGDVLNSSSNEQHPTYEYQDTGTFHTQLTVTNEFGCTDTATQKIKIEADYLFFIPNTFTPNDDGLNEIFRPLTLGVDVAEYDFWVFDRWGDLIFHTNNTQVGWDGRANGGQFPAQQDTYVWKITLKDVMGYKHRYVGHINLIR